MDGLDPALLTRFVQAGHLPHFRQLIASGDYSKLRTTYPPHSPIAWSSFATGMGPGGHGIYDFLHRDPRTYEAFVPATKETREEVTARLVGCTIPIIGPKIELARGGTPFWRHLTRAGVPATLVKVPVNFPAPQEDAFTLSGLGTPDIRGTNGTFSYYTDEPPLNAGWMSNGYVYTVMVNGGRVKALLYGPPDPLRGTGERLTCPFTAHVSSNAPAVMIEVAGTQVLLREQEWSPWVPISFEQGPLGRPLAAIARFYLLEVRPSFKLYVSPLNISPLRPAMPISSPPGYSADIARQVGLFYTQTWPEDTEALTDGIFSDEDYLRQVELVWEERESLLGHVLKTFRGGFLFFYFSTSDLNSHIFWRAQDSGHPAYSHELAAEHGDVILNTYRRLDDILGRVMRQLPPGSDLMVLSDHGFAPFCRSFCANRWLQANGLLAARDTVRPGGLFANVDWEHTSAYAIGFNAVYINRKGREAQGSVDGSLVQAMQRRIRSALLAYTDPATGDKPLADVYIPDAAYRAGNDDSVPDLVLGFRRGYRASWQTALGGMCERIVESNAGKWSGTHLIEPKEVPGVLLTTRPIKKNDPGIEDLGPSICALYGVGSDEMEGRDVFGMP
jgi:predicted AlkP superfamily phosphohydrolase/phosphomutase